MLGCKLTIHTLYRARQCVHTDYQTVPSGGARCSQNSLANILDWGPSATETVWVSPCSVAQHWSCQLAGRHVWLWHCDSGNGVCYYQMTACFAGILANSPLWCATPSDGSKGTATPPLSAAAQSCLTSSCFVNHEDLQIQRIQHVDAYRRFWVRKIEMKENWSHLQADYCFERSLWHGTTKTVPCIVIRDSNGKQDPELSVLHWLHNHWMHIPVDSDACVLVSSYILMTSNGQLYQTCVNTPHAVIIHLLQVFVATMDTILATDMDPEHTSVQQPTSLVSMLTA